MSNQIEKLQISTIEVSEASDKLRVTFALDQDRYEMVDDQHGPFSIPIEDKDVNQLILSGVEHLIQDDAQTRGIHVDDNTKFVIIEINKKKISYSLTNTFRRTHADIIIAVLRELEV